MDKKIKNKDRGKKGRNYHEANNPLFDGSFLLTAIDCPPSLCWFHLLNAHKLSSTAADTNYPLFPTQVIYVMKKSR